MTDQASITCPRCGATSYHPGDIAAGYCAACHWWTSTADLGHPDVIAWAEAEGAIAPLDPDYALVVDFGGRVVGRVRRRRYPDYALVVDFGGRVVGRVRRRR